VDKLSGVPWRRLALEERKSWQDGDPHSGNNLFMGNELEHTQGELIIKGELRYKKLKKGESETFVRGVQGKNTLLDIETSSSPTHRKGVQ